MKGTAFNLLDPLPEAGHITETCGTSPKMHKFYLEINLTCKTSTTIPVHQTGLLIFTPRAMADWSLLSGYSDQTEGGVPASQPQQELLPEHVW